MTVYLLSLKWWRLKVLHIHTGFEDYHLLWICNRKLMEILFIKIN
jgi:hypothetical protein